MLKPEKTSQNSNSTGDETDCEEQSDNLHFYHNLVTFLIFNRPKLTQKTIAEFNLIFCKMMGEDYKMKCNIQNAELKYMMVCSKCEEKS